MKALLIIDMQKVSFTPATPRYQTAEVTNKINQLSESFRKSGQLVVFIQHDGSKQNFCKPRTKEWEILDELVKKDEDIVIPKTANDSFYKTKLDSFLQKHKVKELVITGCATDYCVDSTVKSGLTHDYNVTVIADAHTTADRPGILAEKIIAYYNWLWADMIPTEGKVEVVGCEEFLEGIDEG